MARPRAVSGTGAYQDARQYHKARLSQIREQAVLVAVKNSGCKQQARVSSPTHLNPFSLGKGGKAIGFHLSGGKGPDY